MKHYRGVYGVKLSLVLRVGLELGLGLNLVKGWGNALSVLTRMEVQMCVCVCSPTTSIILFHELDHKQMLLFSSWIFKCS